MDKLAPNVLAASLISKTLSYALNQWDIAIRYWDDGRLDIVNNRDERAIKPFVMGRNAWLFSKTDNGANASETLYSIIETAEANGLVPNDYLMHQIMTGNNNLKQQVLWNVKLG